MQICHQCLIDQPISMKIFCNFIEKIKKQQQNRAKKRLVENFVFLSILQISTYALPFLTIPYLIRVIGIEKYGLIAFAQAISAYLILFTDYGFNLTATKAISINRNDNIELNTIFSSVIYIKFVLLILVSLLYFSMICFVPKFATDFTFFAISFGMVVGNTFFPVWFFQGMERMRYSSMLTIGAKLFFTVLIFVFVKSQSDYIIVPLLNSLGFIVSSIFSFILIYANFNVKLVKVTGARLINELKDGWHVFLSTISISFYRNINIVIMGFFSSGALLKGVKMNIFWSTQTPAKALFFLKRTALLPLPFVDNFFLTGFSFLTL